MVGRDLPQREPTSRTSATPCSRSRLTREGIFVDISFSVRAGEIVALAGLVGAGRSEVARAVFGIDSLRRRLGHRGGTPTAARFPGGGDGRVDRLRARGPSPAGARYDLVDYAEHHPRLAPAAAALRLHHGFARARFAADWALRLQIKYARLSDPVSSLSGGNQQKVVLAKWLARRPSLLIVDEPTRGIDVGTKAEVHRLLDELAEQGVAILMISSELSEVLRVADRILVMREGRLVAEFDHLDASEETIVSAATGQIESAAA